MLRYKMAERGGVALPVSARGTSQECSGCGTVVRKKLSERQHRCPVCGLDIDRDENAALNILHRGQYRRNYGNRRLGRETALAEPGSPLPLGGG